MDVVRDYHNDVCTDGSTCMVYEYKEKADKTVLHVKAFAGYAYYPLEKSENQMLEGENYPSSALEIGLGLEMDFKRVMKGLSVELGVVYSPKTKSEHDVMVPGGQVPSHTIYEMGRWVVRFYLDKKMIDVLWENTSHFGGYLGAGVQMALGKHYARLHADLYRSIGKSDSEMKWGITAEFAL